MKYDIIFISYGELNADENFLNLKKRFPQAQQIQGIKGIHQAHIKAAQRSFTKMFWVVDGDAEILDTFNFDYSVSKYDLNCVHVWRSINPVNDLSYGYGGVKLLPKELTQKIDLNKPDMTTSISSLFKIIPEISNITKFNTDPFSTWRSAFRECAKLSSKIIDRQDTDETEIRLNVWTSVGKDRVFGNYCIDGAIAGKQFGNKYKDDQDKLKLINDFDWLYDQYKKRKFS